ncbi:hypothetical protein NG829_00250 [Xanthomonas sacchari]|uniref:hypothetical protein n=1 Tax=Xanthomonas sacchari TaxID=56458 RepID=UPI00225E390A|nr:hypothetical protein [Xanthomonas sacchari]UYK80799.1 hypothetical protein NG829_00250 [Xanthomonas sacchari]
MTVHEFVSPSEVQVCLERSGYLLESRLVRSLTEADLFVEPNVAHKDPRTGKSRELDLVAEDATGYFHRYAVVKTTFVIEAINNRYPIVLMTERPSTPNSDFESYVKFGWTPEGCGFFNEFNVYEEKQADWENLFSQYCSLTKKSGRDEFMAHHPDDLYSSLLKLSEYTEDELGNFLSWSSTETGQYWRIFFWRPILVIGGQLMLCVANERGEIEIREDDIGRLEFNWHDGEDRKTTVIEFVRESYLLKHVESVRKQDHDIGHRMSDFRGKMQPGV